VLHKLVHRTVEPFLKSVIEVQDASDKMGVKEVKRAIGDLSVSLLHLQQDVAVPKVTLQVRMRACMFERTCV